MAGALPASDGAPERFCAPSKEAAGNEIRLFLRQSGRVVHLLPDTEGPVHRPKPVVYLSRGQNPVWSPARPDGFFSRQQLAGRLGTGIYHLYHRRNDGTARMRGAENGKAPVRA